MNRATIVVRILWPTLTQQQLARLTIPIPERILTLQRRDQMHGMCPIVSSPTSGSPGKRSTRLLLHKIRTDETYGRYQKRKPALRTAAFRIDRHPSRESVNTLSRAI